MVYINKQGGKTMLLTKKELATELKISIPSIDNYMKKGLPYLKVGERSVRFELDKVMRWVEETQEK